MDNNDDKNNKGAIGCSGANNRQNLNSWLRQRALGENTGRRMPTPLNLIKRLKVESSIPLGSVGNEYRFIDWNEQGNLLAYVQKRKQVVVWDVFKQQEKCTRKTGHPKGEYCLKFMRASNDTKVVIAGSSCYLRVTDISNDASSCVSVMDKWLNDLAVHPREPNLIWSVADDGCLLQNDIRQPDVCDVYCLNPEDNPQRIAANPLRGEMLAIGFQYDGTRLFDRRALRSNDPSPCIAHFAHGAHGIKYLWDSTDLAFNSDGSELLASFYGRQVYLFNTYAPWEKYQSFELSIEPLLSDKPELEMCYPLKLKPYSYLKELRKQCPVELQAELKTLCDDILFRTSAVKAPNRMIDQIDKLVVEKMHQASESINERCSVSSDIIDYLNVLLDRVPNCPDLYRARAIALTARDFFGDSYQALRDCCCALALKPVDFETIRCLSATLIKIGNTEDAYRLLDFVKATIKEFGENDDLTRSREMLVAYKKSIKDRIKVHGGCLPPSESLPSPSYLDVNSQECTRPFDYSRRYRNKVNKFGCHEARFFGSNEEFVIGGCDDGTFYIWDKNTTNLVRTVQAKGEEISVRPHPSIFMLATCGYEDTVRLWSPCGSSESFEDQES